MTIKLEEKELQTLQTSQEAGFLKSKISPYLDNLRAQTIAKLKYEFREQALKPQDLQVSIGLLCAMDDLESMLLQQIIPGKVLEKKMAEFEASEQAAERIRNGEIDPYD